MKTLENLRKRANLCEPSVGCFMGGDGGGAGQIGGGAGQRRRRRLAIGVGGAGRGRRRRARDERQGRRRERRRQVGRVQQRPAVQQPLGRRRDVELDGALVAGLVARHAGGQTRLQAVLDQRAVACQRVQRLGRPPLHANVKKVQFDAVLTQFKADSLTTHHTNKSATILNRLDGKFVSFEQSYFVLSLTNQSQVRRHKSKSNLQNRGGEFVLFD